MMNNEETIYPSMVIRSQSEAIELLEKQNNDLQQRIDDAIERLNALIVFWKKYNPIDNTMQVEQFKGVIDILGGKE